MHVMWHIGSNTVKKFSGAKFEFSRIAGPVQYQYCTHAKKVRGLWYIDWSHMSSYHGTVTRFSSEGYIQHTMHPDLSE